MHYILIKFADCPWDFEAYQVTDDYGQTTIVDLDGNLLATPSSTEKPYPFPVCHEVVDWNPPKPNWA
jgi:hypothetical protein